VTANLRVVIVGASLDDLDFGQTVTRTPMTIREVSIRRYWLVVLGLVAGIALCRIWHPSERTHYVRGGVMMVFGLSLDNSAAAGVRLAGTLTLPPGAGPFPGVVLISGSGPNTATRTCRATSWRWFWLMRSPETYTLS
jgi:hypothetical protein